MRTHDRAVGTATDRPVAANSRVSRTSRAYRSRAARARTKKATRTWRQRARGPAFSGGSSFVARMKPADLWYRHDPPHFRWLNRSRFGRVLVHGKMLPRLRIRLMVNRFRS